MLTIKSNILDKMIGNLVEKNKGILEDKRKIVFMILSIIYRLSLDIYFLTVISEIYSYEGLVRDVSVIHYFCSWILYILGYMFVVTVSNYIIAVFLHIQWILTITPVFTIYATQKNKSILFLLCILCVVILQAQVAKKEKGVAISLGNGVATPYFTIFGCILIMAVWIIMVLYNDFAGVKAFDLVYIYQMREKLVYPPLFGYFVSWITRVIIPWFFMNGLVHKKFFLSFYSITFELLFYMIWGGKGPLLSIGVIVVICVLSKYKILLYGTYMGMIACCLFGIIGYSLDKLGTANESLVFQALFGARTLFIPATIKYQFYEVFQQFPKIMFSDGMIGKLLSQTYLYKNNLGTMVYAYFNNGSNAVEANTGYLADGYAQMGLVGMLGMGLLVILVVRFFSKYDGYIERTVLACVVGTVCVVLNDGAFFTSFLTGGIVIYMMLLIIYAKGGKNNDNL